jgi:competence protein ComEA
VSRSRSLLPVPIPAPSVLLCAQGNGLVNINTADATELETLPRVGPATSARIIEWREANGRFATVDDLLAVTGIGEKTLEGFRDLITV